MPIRHYITPLLALFITGCTKPEVKACESHILRKLSSQSSYQRIDVTVVDQDNLTADQFWTEVRMPAPIGGLEQERRLLMSKRMEGKRVGLRVVSIEYDSENSYGSLKRNADECAFLLLDGNVGSQDQLQAAVSRARLRNTNAILSELTGEKLDSEAGRYDCCL